MSKATFLVHGNVIEETSNWQVFCPRCGTDIGTMSISTLIKATHNLACRGGVICPACRERSCKKCGTEIEGFAVGMPVELCVFCGFELAEQEAMDDCQHNFLKTPMSFQEQLETCPLCELELAVGRLTETQIQCLSSISYLKAEEEKAVMKLWRKSDESEFEQAMKKAGYHWLDGDEEKSPNLCHDEDYSRPKPPSEEESIDILGWHKKDAELAEKLGFAGFAEAEKSGGENV